MRRATAFAAAVRRRPWVTFTTSGLIAAMFTLALLRWVGVNDALDAHMRQVFYEVRGERSSDKGVILVEIDDSSILEWGPLPWAPERYVDLVKTIRAGHPRAIAFLEPPSMIWPVGTKSRPEHGLEGVFMPPLRAIRADVPQYLGTGRTVSSLPLRTPFGHPTLFAQLLDNLGHTDRGPELPINFLGPEAQVPLLSAFAVEKGNISAEVFIDHIILIGRAHTDTANSIPTPVGNMSLAELHTHALLGLEDDATWWQPTDAWRWALSALLAMGIMLAMYRRTMRTMFYTAIGLGLGLILVCYVGFTTGTVLLSFADPLSVVLATITVAVLWTEADARFRLARLAHDMSHYTQTSHTSLELFWKEVIRVGQRYTDAHSSMIAELAPGGSSLRIQGIDGVSLDDIAEQNRDLNKYPFRGPLLAKRFEIINDFMAPELGLHTLMVPLMSGTEGIGFWILNFETTELPTPSRELGIERYAEQIAQRLEDLRVQTRRQSRRGHAATRSRDNLTATVDNVDIDVQNLVRQQRMLNDLHTHLPIGVVIASLWQDILLVNEKMTQIASDANIRLSDVHDIAALISKLTDAPLERAQESLRRVAETNTTITLAIPKTDHVLTLSWVYVTDRDGGAPLARFVLTASQGMAPSETPTERVDAFDVNMVIMQVLGILRTDTDLPQRQIRIELEYPTPRARGNPEDTLAALLVMLRDTAVHGNPDMPCMLTVESDNNQLIVSVSDATYSIPASLVESMLRQTHESEDTNTSLSAIKHRLEDTKRGHLEVESMYGSGIMFRLQLPVET